jgi:hypothetical protein
MNGTKALSRNQEVTENDPFKIGRNASEYRRYVPCLGTEDAVQIGNSFYYNLTSLH